jgi:hypothetical protein
MPGRPAAQSHVELPYALARADRCGARRNVTSGLLGWVNNARFEQVLERAHERTRAHTDTRHVARAGALQLSCSNP